MTLLAGVSAAPDAMPETAEKGRAVFDSHCVTCHGPGGRNPDHRRDLSDGTWFNVSPDPEGLRGLLTTGVPGTLMASFEGRLSDEEIAALVAYLLSLDETGSGSRRAVTK